MAEESSSRDALTPRERQVLALLCRGLSNKLIARELRIRTATVKGHAAQIYQKLGVEGRTAAAMRAVAEGYCEVGR